MPDLTQPGAPRWFESDHRTYEGDDLWFVVRFAARPAPATAQKIMTALRTSPLGGPGSAPLAGRDLTLDVTDGELDARAHRRLVAQLDALIDKLHAVAPVAFVFFQPDDATLGLDDDTLGALLDRPAETVARLAGGEAGERRLAAMRADRMLGSAPECVAALLADEDEDVSDAARQAVRHYFLWGASREESEEAREAALRSLRLPSIEGLADYGLGCALYRERDTPRCARTLARITREPGLREPIDRLLTRWRAKGLKGSDIPGSEVVAALALLREQGADDEVRALAKQASARPKGDSDQEVAWIKALVRALPRPASEGAKKRVATPRPAARRAATTAKPVGRSGEARKKTVRR